MTEKRMHLKACRIAAKAMREAGTNNKDLWDGLAIKRAWARGWATDEELMEAHGKSEFARIRATPTRYSAANAATWALHTKGKVALTWVLRWAKDMTVSEAERAIR
jgi:hypothetical protein